MRSYSNPSAAPPDMDGGPADFDGAPPPLADLERSSARAAATGDRSSARTEAAIARRPETDPGRPTGLLAAGRRVRRGR